MDGQAQSERQPIPSGPRELEHEFRLTHLTPLEYAVMSVSILVNGVIIGREEILKKGPGFYLRPSGLSSDATPEMITSFDENRNNKFLEGVFPILDPDIELLTRGDYYYRLWLSRVDEAGNVDPRLKIQMIDADGRVVTDARLLEKVKLDADAPFGFRLEPEVDPKTQEKTGDFYLSFEQPDNS